MARDTLSCTDTITESEADRHSTGKRSTSTGTTRMSSDDLDQFDSQNVLTSTRMAKSPLPFPPSGIVATRDGAKVEGIPEPEEGKIYMVKYLTALHTFRPDVQAIAGTRETDDHIEATGLMQFRKLKKRNEQ